MTKEFERKSVQGNKTEHLYEQYLESKNIDYLNVSKLQEYYHKGDFIVKNQYVDTKSDYQICQWHNIFIEDEIIRDKSSQPGWWRVASYDYLCFDSTGEQLLIFLDYNALHEQFDDIPKHYKSGLYNQHEKAYLNGFLIKMSDLWQRGIIKKVVSYSEDNNFEEIKYDYWKQNYHATKIRQ